MSDNKLAPIGVIVARFQVPKLHAGHIHLVSHVCEKHADVLIVLGYHGGVRTKLNPLTFEERRVMLGQTFPNQPFVIEKLQDHPYSSAAWSRNLDALVEEKFPGRSATLYGSRRSFIPYYSGKYLTVEVQPIFNNSGTATRQELAFPHTEDARAAIIWDQEHRRSYMYSTSDLAIVRSDTQEVLLGGKKSFDGLLSFIGGHAEKKDTGARSVATREGGEEVVGITIGDPVYVDSITINDPRYRGTEDGVMTNFYRAEYWGGQPKPSDDITTVCWVPRHKLKDILVPWHQPLGDLLNTHWV